MHLVARLELEAEERRETERRARLQAQREGSARERLSGWRSDRRETKQPWR